MASTFTVTSPDTSPPAALNPVPEVKLVNPPTENCENSILFVPTVTDADNNIKLLLLFSVPPSIYTYFPCTTFDALLKSVTRVSNSVAEPVPTRVTR